MVFAEVALMKALGIFLALTLAGSLYAYATQKTSRPDFAARFQGLAQELSGIAPFEECTDPSAFQSKSIYGREDKLFEAASGVVLDALDSHPSDPVQAVTEALERLRRLSQKSEMAWDPATRFRYQVLNIAPALVVKFAVRTQETYATYIHGPALDALPGASGKGWHAEAMGEPEWKGHSSFEHLHVYALHRGPSGNPRFLSVMRVNSCAGPAVTFYTAYEWHKISYPPPPPFLWTRNKVLDRKSLDSDRQWPHWMNFEVKGDKLKIPYCWDGGLHMSAWASICSLDTYDLSGNFIRLTGTRTDRPDRAVIARVIKLAQQHDLRAVGAYCATEAVANKVTSLMPTGFLYFVGINAKRLGPGKEELELSDDWVLKFTLVKSAGRWLIDGFSIDQ